MDFAGGTPVHIAAGAAVLAFTLLTHFIPEWEQNTQQNGNNQGIQLNPLREDGMPRSADLADETSASHGGQKGNVDSEPNQGTAMEVMGPQRHQLPPTDSSPPQLSIADTLERQPQNTGHVILGTALLWIGWLGFNGGSALGGNLRAVSACLSTMFSAVAGGCTALTLPKLGKMIIPKKIQSETPTTPSVVLFSDGIIAGLITITPGAGFVSYRKA